jgi:D-glycero-alpha-D-manno-heptose 1-phosphate guanylyltransferase
VKEAIILAGGLGTRLKSVVKDIPKPMANINGKPFLEYIFLYLKNFDIKRVILSVGYKADFIKSYFGDEFDGILIDYSEEKGELLGTGGAIKKSLKLASSNDVFILNGDTFFDVDLNKLYSFHKQMNSKLTISLKLMENFDRYGVIELGSKGKIQAFLEKKFYKNGLINGGVYILNKDFFLSLDLPDKFSFEGDFLEKEYKNYNFYGIKFDTYFIDIGVPEDYEKARVEFKNKLSLQKPPKKSKLGTV